MFKSNKTEKLHTNIPIPVWHVFPTFGTWKGFRWYAEIIPTKKWQKQDLKLLKLLFGGTRKYFGTFWWYANKFLLIWWYITWKRFGTPAVWYWSVQKEHKTCFLIHKWYGIFKQVKSYIDKLYRHADIPDTELTCHYGFAQKILEISK